MVAIPFRVPFPGHWNLSNLYARGEYMGILNMIVNANTMDSDVFVFVFVAVFVILWNIVLHDAHDFVSACRNTEESMETHARHVPRRLRPWVRRNCRGNGFHILSFSDTSRDWNSSQSLLPMLESLARPEGTYTLDFGGVCNASTDDSFPSFSVLLPMPSSFRCQGSPTPPPPLPCLILSSCSPFCFRISIRPVLLSRRESNNCCLGSWCAGCTVDCVTRLDFPEVPFELPVQWSLSVSILVPVAFPSWDSCVDTEFADAGVSPSVVDCNCFWTVFETHWVTADRISSTFLVESVDFKELSDAYRMLSMVRAAALLSFDPAPCSMGPDLFVFSSRLCSSSRMCASVRSFSASRVVRFILVSTSCPDTLSRLKFNLDFSAINFKYS
mmetsp:Transcript_18056/g.41423  ORF Transcript_18056/g.41423 Transcript_18056/m.41423 type:complete len:385 (-) Transcript_18056:738-1892(-)